jgi:hypothetical protein
MTEPTTGRDEEIVCSTCGYDELDHRREAHLFHPAASPGAGDTEQGEDGALYRLGRLGYAIAQILEIDPTDDRITRLLAGPLAPLLAAQEAVQRVRGKVAQAGPMMPRAVVRRALDGC